MIPFTLDEEYSDGEFGENGEFWATNSRKSVQQTREEAIYGVFLASDSDSDGSKRRKPRQDSKYRGIKRQRQDGSYAKPVQFVSSGATTGATAVKVEKLRKLNSSDEEEVRKLYPGDGQTVIGYATSSSESEDGSQPRHHYVHYAHHYGLGTLSPPAAASSALKLGRKQSSSGPVADPSEHVPPLVERAHITLDSSSRSSSDDEASASPAREDQKAAVHERDWRVRLEERLQEKKRIEKEKKDMMKAEELQKENAKRNTLGTTGMSKLYGKGFSMLQKMGYTGGGLGIKGSGIANPLLVKVRKKNMALQDYGERLSESETKIRNQFSSFRGSAVDLLLNRSQKEAVELDTKAENQSRWKKGTQRPKRMTYKTAAEIAAQAKIEARELESNVHHYKYPSVIIHDDNGSDCSLSEEESIDMFGGEAVDINSRIRSSKRQAMKHEQMKLRAAAAAVKASEVQKLPSIRIVDMTGPNQSVIEDVSQLQNKLAAASIRADQSTRLKRCCGVLTPEPGGFENKIAMESTFYSTGEVRPESEEFSDAKEIDNYKTPLGELQYNLGIHIKQIEVGIRNKAKQKIFTEDQFQKSLLREKELRQDLLSAEKELESVKHIVSLILKYRQSPPIKQIESSFNIRTHHQSPAVDQDNKKEARHPQRENHQRRAAIKKYQASAKLHHVLDATTGDKQALNFTDDGDRGVQANTYDALSQKVDQTILLTSDSDHSPEEMMIDVDDEGEDTSSSSVLSQVPQLLSDLTSLFRQLYQQCPKHYFDLQLPLIANQLAASLLAFIDSSPPSSSCIIDPFHLVSLLIDFRDQCLPMPASNSLSQPSLPDAAQQLYPSLQQLRDIWQSNIDQKVISGLQLRLRELQIHPGAQDLAPLETVFSCVGVVPVETVALVIQKEFFPKWIRILEIWLQTPSVDLNEIYDWYNGWRTFFPSTLSIQPGIQACFMSGLQIISHHLEQANEVEVVPMLNRNPPESPKTPPSPPPEEVIPEPPPPEPIGSATAKSRLKHASRLIEALEALAEEKGVLMIPKKGRQHDGKQVYGFGNTSIYVDEGVVHAFIEGRWQIIPLSELLEMNSS